MKNFLILFALLSGCVAFEGKNIIIFPKQTATDHVILTPTLVKPLDQFTICLRSYTDLTQEHAIISIALPGTGNYNAFIIYPKPPNSYYIFINQEEVIFKVDSGVVEWKNTCVTWDSETGLVQLWINGKRYPRKGTKTGSPIGPRMSVVLGQEQDSFGGGFDAKQSFQGEIYDVHMWDYVLPSNTLSIFCYSDLSGNIFDWKNGTQVRKGGVITKVYDITNA
ncbi:hypothetical protein GDO81_014922 [Engystomops pustulosus]|uniref:Pentraxin family member n=1 Tax=Engystomops pustulosus TaxID=76066 RepID=A0AAV7AJQ1_ENGPU|nr:hypothetical protein GDO81_014922 [Engystomops pustulosus]